MSKVHFKKVEGRWFVYRSKHSASYALPVTYGFTLQDCVERLLDYSPDLLNTRGKNK